MSTPRPPIVLMYHSVMPYGQDPYLVTVCPTRLERQFGWLRSRGLRGVSMAELLAAQDAGRATGLVGLTFDDGYADFVEYVVPALHRHGFSATVFVIAGLLGRTNEWDPMGPRKPLMTADDVRAVAADGVEIGSHGLTHLPLPRLDTVALVEQTARSRELLREVSGQPVTGFCYPYGDISGQAVAAVRACGYDYGCAIRPSQHTSRFALPRTYVGDVDTGVRLRAKHLRHNVIWGYRNSYRPGGAHQPTGGGHR